jgi:hypothetical protein
MAIMTGKKETVIKVGKTKTAKIERLTYGKTNPKHVFWIEISGRYSKEITKIKATSISEIEEILI